MNETTDRLIPIHPGEILREEYMKPLGFTGDMLAGQLKVPPGSINQIISGKRGITADMALRLARYFNTTPELWTGLQADYDLRMASMKMQLEAGRQDKMWNYQWVVLSAGLLLFILNGLFPPFEGQYKGNPILTKYMGYHFLLTPPSQAKVCLAIFHPTHPPAQQKGIVFYPEDFWEPNSDDLERCSSHIIASQFFVQAFTIVTATVGAFFLLGMRNERATRNVQEAMTKNAETALHNERGNPSSK